MKSKDFIKPTVAEGGPFSYGAKKPRKGSVADLAAKKRKEQERGRQPAEPRDHMVGVARVVKNETKGVAEAAGLYGPFTVTINTGERPQSRTKTKKFKREDDAILWAQDWLEDFSQYSFATAEVTDPDGNVVWTTDESLEEASVYKKDQDLSNVPTQELEAFVKKHWGGGVPTYGQGKSVQRAMRELRRRQKQGVAEGSLDDIEDTKQLKTAIALAKSQKAIRQAKHGKDQKFYADGTPVTPEEVARRAAERKAKKQGVAEADAELAEPPAPERKQQTKTKQKSKLDPNMFGPKLDQPLAKTDPLDDLKKNAGVHDKTKVNLRKASQQSTLDKTAGLGTPEMGDMLSRMKNIEVDRDLEAYPEPEPPETLPSVEVNTANLPAVAGQALQAAGVQNPDFHQVANLPGNISDQIRQLGKSLFGSLTMTPTKRIHVVANLGGQGPNSTAEVNAVAGFLKEHGRDLGPGDIDFDNVMPGYKAQTHMFSAAGIRWMLVKDFAGQYIYCWPEEDSHDAQDAIGMDRDLKRLR